MCSDCLLSLHHFTLITCHMSLGAPVRSGACQPTSFYLPLQVAGAKVSGHGSYPSYERNKQMCSRQERGQQREHAHQPWCQPHLRSTSALSHNAALAPQKISASNLWQHCSCRGGSLTRRPSPRRPSPRRPSPCTIHTCGLQWMTYPSVQPKHAAANIYTCVCVHVSEQY